jgi:phosphatidyl-myo-inositol dimannoside synthase
MQAPTVAAITLHPTGGGIAVVSRLLWRVLQDGWGTQAQLLTMFDHESRPATFIEKARFTTNLSTVQMLGRTDFILFTHLALSKVHKVVPERARRRYGVFLNGIEVWKPLTAGEEDALGRADLRIAISHHTAARVLESYPGIGPIAVCQLALPTVPEPERDVPLPRHLGPHVVLAVGRMSRTERYKGHDQLIEAWRAIVDAVPDAQLVFVGDGDDAPRLKEKAAASGTNGSILFTGFVSKPALDALYRSAALFALPSRAEGFGLVYLEAMSHRLACIGSIHDAATEVIADGETGQLVDQDDLDCLAARVSSLLLDEPRRRRMGDAGYRRLVSEFSFDRFSNRICSLLHAGSAAPIRAGA